MQTFVCFKSLLPYTGARSTEALVASVAKKLRSWHGLPVTREAGCATVHLRNAHDNLVVLRNARFNTVITC